MSTKGYSAKKPRGIKKPKTDIINGEQVVRYKRKRHGSNELALHETHYGKPAFYAYQIEQDFPEPFKVLNSAGAWWMNKYKVEKLIDAFRMDCTKKEACKFAGISISQLQYFIDKHPDFKDVIAHCKEELGVWARINVARDIKVRRSSMRSIEYLEKKERREKPEKGLIPIGEGGAVLQNNGIIFMDFSKPNQSQPVPIDPTKVHEVKEEDNDTDDHAES
ncbi:MAG: hypothetical protein Tp172MES00d2C118482111_38 [Prokaryotic dsDNA virus sp.]|nr:MAG: hypothetical protein Tp172MES00d2C118482111_38 [Prokaryotic dsDNA virus sp.]|tara:strand:+ start:4407 stop:5066 length:660 start_codon:yes stop_codon:yes gene_type:complete